MNMIEHLLVGNWNTYSNQRILYSFTSVSVTILEEHNYI